MKENIKKWLKPILFTAGGALVGLAYYYFVGCSTGACPLTSNPFITMAYMGFIGWLLSGVFGKGCSGSCNMQLPSWRESSPSYRPDCFLCCPSIPPILQAVGNTPQKDFVGRIGIC